MKKPYRSPLKLEHRWEGMGYDKALCTCIVDADGKAMASNVVPAFGKYVIALDKASSGKLRIDIAKNKHNLTFEELKAGCKKFGKEIMDQFMREAPTVSDMKKAKWQVTPPVDRRPRKKVTTAGVAKAAGKLARGIRPMMWKSGMPIGQGPHGAEGQGGPPEGD